MDNVPVRSAGAPSGGRNAGHLPVEPARKDKRKNNTLKLVLLSAGVVLLALVALGGWSLYQSSARAHIDSSKYQAVFFTNGQVYFGKLHQLGGGYFRLTDVFYIQAKQAAAEDGSKNPQETSDQQTSDVQLIKLGNEVHGPSDEMIISQEQVLFFENLKDDGKVADSITKYQEQKK